jgi:hypothetical protein
MTVTVDLEKLTSGFEVTSQLLISIANTEKKIAENKDLAMKLHEAAKSDRQQVGEILWSEAGLPKNVGVRIVDILSPEGPGFEKLRIEFFISINDHSIWIIIDIL